jgi:hypothetical protein
VDAKLRERNLRPERTNPRPFRERGF